MRFDRPEPTSSFYGMAAVIAIASISVVDFLLIVLLLVQS